jgi:glucose-1-phosphate thymidylyltransferase
VLIRVHPWLIILSALTAAHGREAKVAVCGKESGLVAESIVKVVKVCRRKRKESRKKKEGLLLMKGIVLAGGTGSRLFPLTKITNKHLLPIYDRPMIYYPIQTLVEAGIMDIMVVTGGRNSGDFLRLLANGKQFGLKHINYTYQEGEGGIADALALAEHFADGQKICVVLGDNIIEGNILAATDRFRQQSEGGHILLKEVTDAERFGVAEISGDRIVGIEEKPKKPKSNLAVTGFYMYDASVFDKIKTLVPSGRGELEITDVNNAYIREGTMTFSYLDGWWTDAGTFESLLRAANLVAQSRVKAEIQSDVAGAIEEAVGA